MPQKPLEVLFTKPMNRREFLAHVGAGALAIVGVGGLIRMLTDYGTSTIVHHHRSNGYGSSPYGGGIKQR